jgi:hypothetical protein
MKTTADLVLAQSAVPIVKHRTTLHPVALFLPWFRIVAGSLKVV